MYEPQIFTMCNSVPHSQHTQTNFNKSFSQPYVQFNLKCSKILCQQSREIQKGKNHNILLLFPFFILKENITYLKKPSN